jgi:hypothetical protein
MSYRYDNFPSGDFDAWKTRSDLDDESPREDNTQRCPDCGLFMVRDLTTKEEFCPYCDGGYGTEES